MKIMSKITEYRAKRRLYKELMTSNIEQANVGASAYDDYFSTMGHIFWTVSGNASYEICSTCDISRGSLLSPYCEATVQSAGKTIAHFSGRRARKLLARASQVIKLPNPQKYR